MSNRGYIYILINKSMPGLVKIGQTKKNGLTRAAQISSIGTGVPEPFKLAFEILSEDCVETEKHIHEELNGFRVNKSREFFRVDTAIAIQVVSNCVLSDYNLHVGVCDFTITEDDQLASYGYDQYELIKSLFNIPTALVLKNAIAYHLSKNTVTDAIYKYYRWTKNKRKC